ncbi:MAG: rhodanese-like domain-containing protein [Ectobacillus sp.]
MKTISTAELAKLLNEGKQLNIIDVREYEEVEEGMIPTAKHIPLGDLPVKYTELNKEEEYIMVCRSGARSGRACEFLSEKGFKVVNMVGGMLLWEEEVENA